MYYCQATKTEQAEVVLPSHSPDGPYRLCHAAAERLQGFCLRPSEWFNLAVIHGPFEFHLHDDFYDEDGTALQPKTEVLDAYLYPAPDLEDVAADPEALMDFVGTRWSLQDDAIKVLSAIPPERLLLMLAARHERTRNSWFRIRYYHICGEVLGTAAQGWVREVLHRADPIGQLGIIEAAGSCLPSQEAMRAAFDALGSASLTHPHSTSLGVLAQFRSPLVLDWIENHVGDLVLSDWGRLAALSGIDWPRVVAWLRRGRPLSIVALDALLAYAFPGRHMPVKLASCPPTMPSPPPSETIEVTLRDHANRDNVPRVKQTVNNILDRLAWVRGEKR
jgi:hypothetical protein